MYNMYSPRKYMCTHSNSSGNVYTINGTCYVVIQNHTSYAGCNSPSALILWDHTCNP